MRKCPNCKVELLCYKDGEGAWGVPSYPYESGYYCPKCRKSWSKTEIGCPENEDDNYNPYASQDIP